MVERAQRDGGERHIDSERQRRRESAAAILPTHGRHFAPVRSRPSTCAPGEDAPARGVGSIARAHVRRLAIDLTPPPIREEESTPSLEALHRVELRRVRGVLSPKNRLRSNRPRSSGTRALVRPTFDVWVEHGPREQQWMRRATLRLVRRGGRGRGPKLTGSAVKKDARRCSARDRDATRRATDYYGLI